MALIVTLTLLPYEVMHSHAEHEHAYAKHHHFTKEQHHCELDDLVCEQNPDLSCEHPFHISTPKHKCFSCSYHFTKNYLQASKLTWTKTVFEQQLSFNFISIALQKAVTRISNKGPPCA